jgi:hypothetical protein
MLVAPHVVLTHSGIFVTRAFGVSSLTVVALGNHIPMCPTVAALVHERSMLSVPGGGADFG